MGEFETNSSKHNKLHTCFLLNFTTFASKAISETDLAMSPTSILGTKPFSSLKNPFWADPKTPKSKNPETILDRKLLGVKFDPKGVGLSIVDHLTDENYQVDPCDTKKKPENSKLVLFGSQLKLQIPPQPSSLEFGIKTKNSSYVVRDSFGSPNSGLDNPDSPWISNGSLSVTEMALSEDYTCVIARGGSVTKTTRIFEDCVVESCFGEAVEPMAMACPFESFLSFCHTCKKKLGQGKDIYMYRGEKAFCSDECRRQEMEMEMEMEDVVISSNRNLKEAQGAGFAI